MVAKLDALNFSPPTPVNILRVSSNHTGFNILAPLIPQIVLASKPSHRPRRPFSNSRSQPSHRSLSRQQENKLPTSGNVVFMAIANEFSLGTLYRRLLDNEDQFGIHPSAYGAVLRLERSRPPITRLADAFVFAYGCLVVWGSDEDCERFLSATIDDALQIRSVPAVDSMQYRYGTEGSVRFDVITLTARPENLRGTQNELKPHLERMSISCGLAQSIKLGAYESSVRSTIESTRHLIEKLADSGTVAASHQDISRLLGKLFLDRYRYHLSGDLLVTPAFFWENEQYLPSYRRVERYFEVRERGDTLNKRVEVVQELFKLLRDEISNQHSIALEVAITSMIAFEILLTLVTLTRENMRNAFIGCILFLGLAVLSWVLWRLYRRKLSTLTSKSSRTIE